MPRSSRSPGRRGTSACPGPSRARPPITSPRRSPGLASAPGSRHAPSIVRAGREQRVEVDPDERRRHEPDVGQRRVPAADVGRVEEPLAQLVVVGDRLEAPPGSVIAAKNSPGCWSEPRAPRAPPRRATRRRRGTRAARSSCPTCWRRSRASRADRGRPRRGDRGRIGRVEDAQVEVALGRPEGPVEDVRGEARAAHAHDDRGVEAGLVGAVAEALERGGLGREVRRARRASRAGPRCQPRRPDRPSRARCRRRTGARPSRSSAARAVSSSRARCSAVPMCSVIREAIEPSLRVGRPPTPCRRLAPSPWVLSAAVAELVALDREDLVEPAPVARFAAERRGEERERALERRLRAR